MTFQSYLTELPLVAILRGLRPDDALDIGHVLVEAGFRIIEVPLNSPEPFHSIEFLARSMPETVLVGAGTVLDPQDVDRLRDSGGRLVVMPHGDPEVVRRAKELGLYCTPGVATPSEGFAALKAGADALKLFPAEAIPPHVVRAWRAVLPKDVLLLPVGGISPESMKGYVQAGASGFGLGSALFTPRLSPGEVRLRSQAFALAWDDLRPQSQQP
jgi:2-dehydro-3-deoxyphosphogalactonate aldolase